MTEQTYTVTDYNGEVIARHLSAYEAAKTILTDDGRDWEIREENGGGFALWSCQPVANRPWRQTIVYSAADTREEAEAEIFAEVVAASWRHHPTAMTDEAFDRMMAELNAE